MLCIVDCIRARNGRFHRMCCKLGTDTCLFAGDAQIARTTYSNFGTLRHRFGAIQIRSWRKPSRVRSDDDSIQISLNSILYAAALLGPPLPGPYLLTQRPCLDLRCQALTYVLTSSCQCTAGMFRRSDLLFCFCKPNSWPRIFKGRN